MKTTKKKLADKKKMASRKPQSLKRRKLALAKKSDNPTISTPEAPAPIVAREEVVRAPYEKSDNSALTLYLREIGETKLLTPAEEVVLAKRIQKGDKNAR